MSWIADLHIHSHFSMATSKDCTPASLWRWAGLKGVSLIGAGDFTHPGWRRELRETLVPAEPGFYKLPAEPSAEIPRQPEVRFVISGEISTIYKKNGQTRKVHHLIILPSLEAADRVSDRLEAMGMNLRSDGRPILGLDSYRLLEILLETAPEAIYIPAHIWTPHFSVFGSKSGFDDFYECYEDLSGAIDALETGLSSDPAMNWRWSALDRFKLVSNSDAHNPQNLAREANLFEAEFSYRGLQNALKGNGVDRLTGTIEFFPEEGKYHLDGHRGCQLCWEPAETIGAGGICPKCGKPITVGVLHRVVQLADRDRGFRPPGSRPYQSLAPLRQIIGDCLNLGVSSNKVEQLYFSLLRRFGPELVILREIATGELETVAGPLLATAVERIRKGELEIRPGYDGEYGVISIFTEAERQALQGQNGLFDFSLPRKKQRKLISEEAAAVLESRKRTAPETAGFQLSDEQQRIIHSTARFISVVAGPGAGKTRTLVEKIAYLTEKAGVNPGEITAVTFTNRAAGEIRDRLLQLFGAERKKVRQINLGTFHSLAWRILKQNPTGFTPDLLDQTEAKEIIEEILRENKIPRTAREAALAITIAKNSRFGSIAAGSNLDPRLELVYRLYQERLKFYRKWDFDDLIPKTVELWREAPPWLAPPRKSFQYLLIDEFQDLNPAQYELVKYWADECRQLMVIGDPNQSIYGFRGADGGYFERLVADYPETVAFRLTYNYRSPAPVIAAANALIAPEFRQNAAARDNSVSRKLYWIEAATEKNACRALVGEISNLLGGSTMLSAHGQAGKLKQNPNGERSFSLSEIAVLYRAGRQAAALEEALTIDGLPYRVVGRTGALESPMVKETLAFFRYLYHPDDRYLLRTVWRQSCWGLTPGELEKVNRLIYQESATLCPADWVNDPEIVREPGLARKIAELNQVVRYYQDRLQLKSTELLEDWMFRRGLAGVLELQQLLKISENYQDISGMLKALPLAEEADIIRYGRKVTGTEAITLSTIHAAKGLEFPAVFIYGVEEGLIPIDRALTGEALMEEERLFYVAVTRAQFNLYLINSQLRFQNGAVGPVEVSRFLRKIPPGLLEKREVKRESLHHKQLELF